MMRTVYLLLFILPLPAVAQEWFCKNPSSNDTYTWYSSVSCVAGGKAYFGTGRDNGNFFSQSVCSYDPATNVISSVPWIPGMARNYATSFGVGNYAYFGLGNDQSLNFLSDFWKYDPATSSYGAIAPFPGGARANAFAFTIGSKAYVGGGYYWNAQTQSSTFFTDLWEYDPAANTWTAKANTPGNTGGSPVESFTIAGRGYVMRDGSTALWEYDAAANSWAAKAPFPGGNRSGITAFEVNGFGYVGCGYYQGVYKQDLFAYDPVSNSWSNAPSLWASFGRSDAVGFSINNKGYVFGGHNNTSAYALTDLFELGPAVSPALGAWSQRPFLPAIGRYSPIAFSIGGKGYVGGGINGSALLDFYEYDPLARAWTPRATLPGPVDEGFSIGGTGYVTLTTASQNFWAFDPLTNTWSPRADLPGGARNAACSFAMEGKAYVGTGYVNNTRQSDMWAYDPTTNTWTQRANVPGSAVHSASGFAIGNKGYVGGGNLGGNSTAVSAFSRYDPVTNTWTSMGALPGGNKQAAQAFAIGNRAYLGGGVTGGPIWLNRFDVYDPVSAAWTQLADLGGQYRYLGVGFSIGDRGFIFGGEQTYISNSTTNVFRSAELWEYTTSTISIAPKLFLEGPFDSGSQLMSDALHAALLLPVTDPYGTNGYPYPGGTYGDIGIGIVPATTGNDAIVDRVLVELRDATTPSQVKASRSVWVQRDGDVVDMDGISPVRFNISPGSYHVAVKHRNHLGVMTGSALLLSSTPTSVDFTSAITPIYGTNARKTMGGKQVLWMGDATFNNVIAYTGAGNDRDPILLRIGGTVPNATTTGYFPEDTNLDGVVKYTGANNDRDPILLNIGGVSPTVTRAAQLP